MSQGDSRLPDGPPREQPTVMRAQGAGVRVREPTTVAPQTRRRRSGVAEDWGPSSRLCTQDPVPCLGAVGSHAAETVPQGEGRGWSTPGSRRATRQTSHSAWSKEAGPAGGSRGRGPRPLGAWMSLPLSWDFSASALNGTGTKRFLRPFPAGHSRTPML